MRVLCPIFRIAYLSIDYRARILSSDSGVGQLAGARNFINHTLRLTHEHEHAHSITVVEVSIRCTYVFCDPSPPQFYCFAVFNLCNGACVGRVYIYFPFACFFIRLGGIISCVGISGNWPPARPWLHLCLKSANSGQTTTIVSVSVVCVSAVKRLWMLYKSLSSFSSISSFFSSALQTFSHEIITGFDPPGRVGVYKFQVNVERSICMQHVFTLRYANEPN